MPESTITPPATDVMLATRGLVSGYGRIETIHGIDVDVPTGRISAIIGPNGSGKSTLLKAVAGLLRPWEGSVTLGDDDITGSPAHALVHHGLCMVPQGRVVFPGLTVEENLRMSAYTVRSKQVIRDRLDESFAFFPVLAERRNQLASTLSGGEQVMLSIAKVTMVKPRLLLLDEPSLGLSPKMMDFVYERIVALGETGLTTLIVEQNVRKVLTVADHVIVLVLGDVRYTGTPKELEETIDLGTLFLEGKL